MPKEIDWKSKFSNPEDPDTANTLREAKEQQKRFYRHQCPKHGCIPFRTLDNSCPVCAREGMSRRMTTDRAFNRSRNLLLECKRRAKEQGRDFDLDVPFLRAMVPTHCPILGMPLISSPVDSPEGREASPSIDRLDSSLGYVKPNIRVISYRANRIKNNGTAEEHLRIAFWQLEQAGVDLEDIKTMTLQLLESRSQTVHN